MGMFDNEAPTLREVEFFIPCNPPKATAQASHRIMKKADGTMFVGKSQNSNAAKAQKTMFALLNDHRPEVAFEGPVRLEVHFCWPWRKSEPKKNRVKGWRRCDKRPDCSNLIKMLEDCMTRLAFWGDDSQVAELVICKSWGEKPGIYIRVAELEP